MTSVLPSGRRAAHKEYDGFEREHEELKANRLPIESLWRDVADYVATTDKTGPIDREGFQLPRNRLDATTRVALRRCSHVMNGYLFNPFNPFFRGKHPYREKLNREERLYYGEVSRRMHAHLTGPRAPFRLAMGRALYSAGGYGNAPLHIGRKGRLLLTSTISVWDAWVDEDPETGLTDTRHWQFRMPAWRAAKRWPHVEKLAETGTRSPYAPQTFVRAVHPNPGGAAGAVKSEKPFTEITVWMDGREVVERDGWDDFPGAMIRWDRRENSAYGYGPGIEVLPWAKLINAREDNALQAEEQNINPTLLDWTGGAVDPMDRRPGAHIPMNPQQAGLWGRPKAYERLYDPVDLRDAHTRIEALAMKINGAFFVDWLTPGEGAYVTATYVNDRRDLRMRAMASVVAGMEYDFNQIGDRFFRLMNRMGLLPDPPDSLVGEEIVFDFISPLAMAQQSGEVEKLMAFLEIVATAAGIDPTATRVPDVHGMIREAGRSLGISEDMIRSAQMVDADMRAAAQNEEAAQEAALGESAAQILRDAGQGAAALAGAGAPRELA